MFGISTLQASLLQQPHILKCGWDGAVFIHVDDIMFMDTGQRMTTKLIFGFDVRAQACIAMWRGTRVEVSSFSNLHIAKSTYKCIAMYLELKHVNSMVENYTKANGKPANVSSVIAALRFFELEINHNCDAYSKLSYLQAVLLVEFIVSFITAERRSCRMVAFRRCSRLAAKSLKYTYFGIKLLIGCSTATYPRLQTTIMHRRTKSDVILMKC